ncbi:hypothetical protein BCEN4_310048 [Burkholderia cenocepacia]|nr:hypothetical protein BCEN4_310048 [Burkholderia cenocepacia]
MRAHARTLPRYGTNSIRCAARSRRFMSMASRMRSVNCRRSFMAATWPPSMHNWRMQKTLRAQHFNDAQHKRRLPETGTAGPRRPAFSHAPCPTSGPRRRGNRTRVGLGLRNAYLESAKDD